MLLLFSYHNTKVQIIFDMSIHIVLICLYILLNYVNTYCDGVEIGL